MKHWKTARYVRRGLSHIARDTICQDRAAVRENERCIAAVLADGVGLLPNSALAAETVVNQLSKTLLLPIQDYDSVIVPSAAFSGESEHAGVLRDTVIQIAKKAIRAAANKNGIPTKSMGCTLSFLWIDKVSGKAVVGVLGDGAVCVFSRSGSAEAITSSGQLANKTETVFDADAASNMQIRILDTYQEEIVGFLLVSDGLANEIYMKNTSVVCPAAGEYLNSLCGEEEAEDILSARIDRLTCAEKSRFDDDISIAVIGCLEEPVELPPHSSLQTPPTLPRSPEATDTAGAEKSVWKEKVQGGYTASPGTDTSYSRQRKKPDPDNRKKTLISRTFLVCLFLVVLLLMVLFSLFKGIGR